MRNIGENEITNIGGIFNYINGSISEIGYDNQISQSASDWANKTISTTNGAETNSTTRLTLVNSIPVESDKKYILAISNDTYELFNLHAYDVDNAWLGAREYFGLEAISGSTLVEFTTLSDVKYIKVVIRKANNETITTSEIETTGITLKEF